MDQITKPVPGPGQALVKIKAFGLNRMDISQREGRYPVPPQAPETLGVEFSGTVESFGSNDHEDLKVGDEVFGLAYGGEFCFRSMSIIDRFIAACDSDSIIGAYAEYIAVSTKMMVHKPKQLSWEEAAGLPEASFIYATKD